MEWSLAVIYPQGLFSPDTRRTDPCRLIGTGKVADVDGGKRQVARVLKVKGGGIKIGETIIFSQGESDRFKASVAGARDL